MTFALVLVYVVLLGSSGDRPDYRDLIGAGSVGPIDAILISEAGLDTGTLLPQRTKQLLARQSKTLGAISRGGGARTSIGDRADLDSSAPGGSPPDMASIRLASALLRLSCRAQIAGPEHDRGIDSMAGFIVMAEQLAKDESVVGSQLSAWLLKQFFASFDEALAIDRVAPTDAARLLSAMQRIDPTDPIGLIRGAARTAERWKRIVTEYRVAVDAGESPAFPTVPGATGASPTEVLRGFTMGEIEAGSGRVAAALRGAKAALVAAAADPAIEADLCSVVEAQVSGSYERAVLSEQLLGRALCVGLRQTAELAAQLRSWRTTAQAIVDGTYENVCARRSAYFWVQSARSGVADSADLRARMARADSSDAVSPAVCAALAEPRLLAALAKLGGQQGTLDWSNLSQWRNQGIPDVVAGWDVVSVLRLMEWRAQCISQSTDRKAVAQAEIDWLRAARDACVAGSVPTQIMVRRSVAQLLERSRPRLAVLSKSDAEFRSQLAAVAHDLALIPPMDLEGWANGVRATLAGRIALRADLREVRQFTEFKELLSEPLASASASRVLVTASTVDLADWSPDERRDQVLAALGELFWKEGGADQLAGRLSDLRRIDVRLLEDPRGACQILTEPGWSAGVDVHDHGRALAEAVGGLERIVAASGD